MSLGGSSVAVPDTLRARFNTRGVLAALAGTLGEPLVFTRASSATLLLGGQEYTAATNQARVGEDGILLEPATTQLLLDVTNLSTANWTGSAATVSAGQTDPLGGTSAFLLTDDTSTGGHGVYQAGTLSTGTTTAISVYAKAGTKNWIRLGTGSFTFSAWFHLTGTGAVGTTTGTGTRAEIESVGGGWYRCSIVVPSPGAGLLPFVCFIAPADNSGSYTGDGAGTVLLWRPQTEHAQYATSWTATSRAAEQVLIPIPNLCGDWCIEITATPCGSQSWTRGGEDVVFSVGFYGSTNSIEGFINAGSATLTVTDGASGTKSAAASLASGTYAYGQRRIGFASRAGTLTVYVDGRPVSTSSGSGTGIFAGGAPGTLLLGATSSGLGGGFCVRDVRVVAAAQPPNTIVGATSYTYPFPRGYVPPARAIAFLGDSNTAGTYDASITTPYPVGACALLGATYVAHNYGIGGNGSAEALLRYKLDIQDRGYTEMVIFIGINDINAGPGGSTGTGFPASWITGNITAICQLAAADGTRVVVITLLPGGQSVGAATRVQLDAVNTFLRSSVPAANLVDAYALFDDGTGKIKSSDDLDGSNLHLSQTGQTALAAAVAAALAGA